MSNGRKGRTSSIAPRCAGMLASLAFGLAALAGAQASAGARADSPAITLPRNPCLSPDGSEIAFSYQGDLWIVAREGGEARRLTAHAARETSPRWSPDGQWIAFSSDREGNDDIFVIPVAGGPVRRVTWSSFQDTCAGWTPDSRAILFRSWRPTTDADNPGTFLVPLTGGTPFAVVSTGANAPAVSPEGLRIAFARGSVDWSRRGYEGSGRHHLWICTFDEPLLARATDWPMPGFRGIPIEGDADGARACTQMGVQAAASLRPAARFEQLGTPGREPAWFPDGKHLLFLGEQGGITNLEILALATRERTPLTRFTAGRLRSPSLSADGRYAVAEYEDGLIVVAVPPELLSLGARWTGRAPEPRRVPIRIPLDLKAPATAWVKVSAGAEDLALSGDGKQIAFVARGEVFVMKASDDEPAAYNASQSQARDRDIAWLPDSSGLIFASDRAGNMDLYRVRSADANEPRLARALHHELTRLTDDPSEDMHPRVSPDGKRIAFLRGRRTLMVVDADGKNATELAHGMLSEDHAWSPDSRWIAYTMDDSDFNSDVYIVAADGKTGPYNISQHPDSDSNPAWSANGRVIAFTSSRAFLNQTDIWFAWLTQADEERSREERLDELSGDRPQGKGAAKSGGKDGGTAATKGEADGDAKEEDEADAKAGSKPKKEIPEVRIDFENIAKRLHRLTTFPGTESDVLVSSDAGEFVFVGDTDGKQDLWKVKWDGSEPKRLTQGGQSPSRMQWDDSGKKIFYLKSGGAIASVPLDGGESKSYGYEAELMIDQAAQRAFVFDEAWRELNDQFYDEHFHGADWRALHDHYRPWALAASTYRDFQDVVRMMMGELNASHLGIWGGPGDPDARGDALAIQTGELGVIFTAADAGPGLRVAHVVKGTPADRVESRLAAGDRIVAIDGVTLQPSDDVARLLERTVGKRTVLQVIGEGGQPREVVLRPIGGQEFRDRLYEEEIELRQECVARATGGKVAYIHVRAMDEGSLELFERDLYAEAHGRDALIIDVRNNGGGWTTDLLLTSLSAPDHAVTQARGGGPGYPAGRRLIYAWTKPIVVLCDEYSFSNAEIFSWAIRTIRRGPVVGQQTFGGVISTGGTSLLDGSYLRLPFRGWHSKLDGSNLEGTGCMPDIVVENVPGDLARGVDLQLARAIEEALRQVER